jgi:membrane protein YqaA with SNARE-associated domain
MRLRHYGFDELGIILTWDLKRLRVNLLPTLLFLFLGQFWRFTLLLHHPFLPSGDLEELSATSSVL